MTKSKLPFLCTPSLTLIESTRGRSYFLVRLCPSWLRCDWAWSAHSCCVSRPSCWMPGCVERATQTCRRPCCARRRSPFAPGPSLSSLAAAALFAQPPASGCIASSPTETRSSSGRRQKEVRRVPPKALLNCQWIYPNTCFGKVSDFQLASNRWRKVFGHLICL